MKDKGYFGIGCFNMKTETNYGTLYRTAQILDADFIFLIGARFTPQSSDTMKSWKHLPLFLYNDFDDFNSHRPYGCQLIGVELTHLSVPLDTFKHPKQACYLLGAEDHGLPDQVISHCHDIVFLPGKRSMNVSVAGSIVLYDRFIKNKF